MTLTWKLARIVQELELRAVGLALLIGALMMALGEVMR